MGRNFIQHKATEVIIYPYLNLRLSLWVKADPSMIRFAAVIKFPQGWTSGVCYYREIKFLIISIGVNSDLCDAALPKYIYCLWHLYAEQWSTTHCTTTQIWSRLSMTTCHTNEISSHFKRPLFEYPLLLSSRSCTYFSGVVNRNVLNLIRL